MSKAYVYQLFTETDIFGEKKSFKEKIGNFPSAELAQKWIMDQKDPYDFYIIIDGRTEK